MSQGPARLRRPYFCACAGHRPRGAVVGRIRLWGFVTAALLVGAPARAEGTAQVGTKQALRAGTVLGVDIVDAVAERIVWTGRGSVSIKGPGGEALGTATSGQIVTPSAGSGAYQLTVALDQTIGSTWDVAVQGATEQGGRLFSKNWLFNAGSFASSAATNASFYALVPAGTATSLSVVELQLSGLAGYVYDINANATGVDGVGAGRSVSELGNSVTPLYRIYLRVPTLANFISVTPVVSSISYVGGVDQDIFGAPMTPCNEILPGGSRGYFSFSSTVEGSYHLQCDLDGDGQFSLADGGDLLLVGEALVGNNVVPWDGVNGGVAVASGNYQCRVQLAVGEFHYVGRDIETSYPGMRIYRVNADGGRTGLKMYWNDALVQAADTLMPNGQFGRERSEGEVLPGPYESAAVANTNARSWGDFTGAGKGNVNYLDTFVWLDETTSSLIEVRAADGTDTDSDGLSDYRERCLIGSDPESADTDGNGTTDGQQYAIPQSSIFSGLESNGRMANALARRAIRRTRMSVDPMEPFGEARAALGRELLTEWIPPEHDGAASTGETPGDLLQLTNASAVAGSDYVDSSGQRRGGVLLVSTKGSFYEHQKPICDRVHGSELIDVASTNVRGAVGVLSTIRDPWGGRLEYSTSMQFWRNAADSRYSPVTFWLAEDAPSIGSDAETITAQVWGDTPDFVNSLLASVSELISHDVVIQWPEALEPIADQDYVPDSLPAPVGTARRPPRAVMTRAGAFAGRVDVNVRRLEGGGPLRLEVSSLTENGRTTARSSFAVDAQPGQLQIQLPGTLESTIDLVDGEEVVDRVWVSDGAWAAFDDQVWQGHDSPGAFSRTECVSRALESADRSELSELPAEEVAALSGCARVSYATQVSSGGVARQLTRPLDTTMYQTLAYHIISDRGYEVCLESASGRGCVAMPPRPRGAWEAIPMRAFEAPGESQVTLISFAVRDSMPEVEVSGLSLLQAASTIDTRPAPSEDDAGCSLSPTPPRAWWLGLAVLALGACRRLRRQRT